MRRSIAFLAAAVAALAASAGWLGGPGSTAGSAATAQLVRPEASAPLQPQLVYGLGDSGPYSGQVLVSQDGGATWKPQPKSPNTPLYDIQLLGNGQTALGFFTDPIYGDKQAYSIVRSVDGGATWQVVKHLVAITGPGLTVDPGGSSTAAACNAEALEKRPAGYGGPGVFVSRDGGMTWKRTLREPCYSLAIQPGGRVMLASTATSPARVHLWRSTNGGASWHRIRVTMPYYPGYHQRWQQTPWDMVFDPSAPQVVVADAEGDNLFRSTDAGRTWKHVWSTFTRPKQKLPSWNTSFATTLDWNAGRFDAGIYLHFKHGSP